MQQQQKQSKAEARREKLGSVAQQLDGAITSDGRCVVRARHSSLGVHVSVQTRSELPW